MRVVLLYLIAAVIFLAIDFVWLSSAGNKFYRARMGSVMRDDPNLPVAAIFYAVFVIGLMYFAILPADAEGSWQSAAWNGMLFGFFAYLTYDATSYSVIEGFDPVVAIVDTIWGSLLSGFVAAITIIIANALLGSAPS